MPKMTISKLFSMSDEEIIKILDRQLETTQLWVDTYLPELHHRQHARIADEVRNLTRRIFCLTIAVAVIAVVTAVAAVATLATTWG